MSTRKGKGLTRKHPGTAVYHRIYAREDYETAAEMLWELTRDAVRRTPGKPRGLYLDIDGHRNAAGGFDRDMLELQTAFIQGRLAQYFTEIHMPLLSETGKHWRSLEKQRDDIPEYPAPWTAAETAAWEAAFLHDKGES